jgi:TPP-dependent pyruvate/acetoin dehydrogenase alpha subunit
VTIVPIPVDEALPGDRPDDLGDDELLGLYRAMRRVRAFEDEVVDAFGQGLIPGSTHPHRPGGIKAGAICARRARPGLRDLPRPGEAI